MMNTEKENEYMYNRYMLDILNPELRQMFMQMRDNKVQQITRLQQEMQKAAQQ